MRENPVRKWMISGYPYDELETSICRCECDEFPEIKMNDYFMEEFCQSVW